MDELLLHDHELPEPLRQWLNAADAPPDRVVSIERLRDGRVLLRSLPGIEPAFVARLQVTLAQYREALMNLT